MSQFLAITRNTFVQTVRQPIYAIIVLVTLGGLALAPSLTGWTLDDDNKMLRDLGLSTLLVQGLFLSCFAASVVLNAEIEDKTVLTSVAKPVGRPVLVLGKYTGVLGALLVAHYLENVQPDRTLAALYLTPLRERIHQNGGQVYREGPQFWLLIDIKSAGVETYTWRRGGSWTSF